MNDQEKWDRRYLNDEAGQPSSAAVLHNYIHLLPTHGRALDLASGLGGNALLLAEHGLETHAWDVSSVALERLQQEAHRRGITVVTEVRDLSARPPQAGYFDVIVVSRFLDRNLCPAIAAALRPGGLLFYQTFTSKRSGTGGPSNPDFLLKPSELLQLFSGLRVVVYRDEGEIGDLQQGLRNEAQLIAQRRLSA